MGSSWWEDLKKTVKAGVSVAAEKTEEYTKIGKLKVEILNLNRNLDKSYSELGKEAFEFIKAGKRGDLGKLDSVKQIIEKIEDQKAQIKAKEDAIEAVLSEEAACDIDYVLAVFLCLSAAYSHLGILCLDFN